jgi:hypothetical protein
VRRALLLLAGLGLTACGTVGHEPAAAPSPTPTATARTLADAVELDQFDGLSARPSVSTKVPGGSRSVLSVTPDGLLVTVVSETPPPGPEPGIKQSHLELVDPAGATVAIPGQDGARPRQAVAADADDRYVVWMETPSTQVGTADWVLLAYDRRAKQTHVVDRAATGADTSANTPMLVAGRVWWSVVEFTGDEGHPPTTNLYSRSLTDATPARLEVSDLAAATLSDNRLVYTAATPGVARQLQLHRRYLATGADTVIQTVDLGPDETLHSLTAAGDNIAWTVSHNDPDTGITSRVMLRQSDGTLTMIDGGQLSLAVDALTPDFLAWHDGDQNGGEWILDRHDDRIVHLSSQPGLAAIEGSGNHLAWREGDAWRVADLT